MKSNGEFRFSGSTLPDYANARVVRDRHYVVAEVMASLGGEAELALCLAGLVEAGVIDLEKLKAAFVLAGPVAREHLTGKVK